MIICARSTWRSRDTAHKAQITQRKPVETRLYDFQTWQKHIFFLFSSFSFVLFCFPFLFFSFLLSFFFFLFYPFLSFPFFLQFSFLFFSFLFSFILFFLFFPFFFSFLFSFLSFSFLFSFLSFSFLFSFLSFPFLFSFFSFLFFSFLFLFECLTPVTLYVSIIRIEKKMMAVNAIRAAFNEYKKKTCITFVPRTTEAGYLTFTGAGKGYVRMRAERLFIVVYYLIIYLQWFLHSDWPRACQLSQKREIESAKLWNWKWFSWKRFLNSFRANYYGLFGRSHVKLVIFNKWSYCNQNAWIVPNNSVTQIIVCVWFKTSNYRISRAVVE